MGSPTPSSRSRPWSGARDSWCSTPMIRSSSPRRPRAHGPSAAARRMMRFERGGVRLLVDYAHNAAGLRGLLGVAEHLRAGRGRLGLLLGHAGNRQDAEIEQLARVAAEFHPALVVVKENEAHLRGREPGEIPRIIRA